MVNYYPLQLSFKQLSGKIPDAKLVDFEEEQRVADVMDRRRRGKGAPKKAKTKGAHLLERLTRSILTIPQRIADAQPRRNGSSLCIVTRVSFSISCCVTHKNDRPSPRYDSDDEIRLLYKKGATIRLDRYKEPKARKQREEEIVFDRCSVRFFARISERSPLSTSGEWEARK